MPEAREGGESVVWWYLPHLPHPEFLSPLPAFKTACHFQVDSTRDVCSSTLPSRLAAAHPVVVRMKCSPAGLADALGYFRQKGSQVGGGRWRKTLARFLDVSAWIFILDFPHLS